MSKYILAMYWTNNTDNKILIYKKNDILSTNYINNTNNIINICEICEICG